MREDCINVVIFALLTFPSTEFNMENLVTAIGPYVTDQKKRVRQASMECLALLSQCLGPGKVLYQIISIISYCVVRISLSGSVNRYRLLLRSKHQLLCFSAKQGQDHANTYT